ncbi:hypothetical protein P691DRAFT_758955 [Macrolepiota fuliginosa MF-IS2]|uniref:F-box domain-containing protein n=1 Tax=Macrolepiota fuliginosa MF-IS2 TaxID=1400762 RepID=A0A9P5XGU9_9AGAR|nr:hypothetical protein P691DRAFT_758955 [Macrolepiota fuliginosa MF-IS2]
MCAAWTEEIQRLGATIDELEAEVQLIKSRQSALRRRLNELVSPTRRLPPEVLSNIFLDVCADRRSWELSHILHPAVQVIGQVCSSWHHIVRATPSLWTRVTIRFADRLWVRMDSLNLLRLHYERIGELPLNIEMTIPRYEPRDIHPPPDYFLDNPKFEFYEELFRVILIEHPTELGSLTLCKDQASPIPEEWLGIMKTYTTARASKTVGFPKLASLILHSSEATESDRSYPLFHDTPVPLLRHCSFAHQGRVTVQIPSTNLTSLHLSYIPPRECIQLLALCPGLIDFRQRSPGFRPGPAEGLELQRVMTLPNLRTLHWSTKIGTSSS